ncbi:MAG TPA: pitrilysin family protein [Candidatus Eisenbacteria bacterium]
MGAALAATLVAAPVDPAAAGPLHLPPATRLMLRNGLTVWIVPTHRLPLVDLRLVVRAGAVDDPPGKEGLAHLTAELLTQGATVRDARQLAEDIAFVGGSLEASTGVEQLVVSCEVLKKDLATGLALFHDVIVAPSFAEPEFQRMKGQVLGNLVNAKNDPDSLADLELLPFLLGLSPLAHPPSGWGKSVARINREDVVAFHGSHVRPDRAMLAVVGDIDPEAMRSMIEHAFADWKPSGEKAREAYATVPQVHGRQLRIVSRPEVTQTQIRLACLGVPRDHPDYYPILVANTILGGAFMSRLVEEIRINQGLTYGIGSRFGMLRNAGTFTIRTFTRNETIRRTIDATLAEMKKLVDQGPTEDELAQAKRYLTGQFPLGLQAPDALAAQLLDVEFYRLDPHVLETFPDRVGAVTMEDCRRALKSYFCVDDLRILVVSDPAVAKPQLEGLGPVEVKEPQ